MKRAQQRQQFNTDDLPIAVRDAVLNAKGKPIRISVPPPKQPEHRPARLKNWNESWERGR